MVFTRTDKELATNSEKWMKATTRSYTITAALITTIVFLEAVTVPGGNNQDTWVPFVTNNPAFTVFAISDTLSLFTGHSPYIVVSVLVISYQAFYRTRLSLHVHDVWCDIVQCVWTKELFNSYSHSCLDYMPTNYVFCDLAISSCGRLDECHGEVDRFSGLRFQVLDYH
ncbi:ankyrin repeat-containing domain, PGG domain protein [Artemisia annua]|uniref:Ankyrin repeat-containing domain, PGG domain protein n=1 Tax=Artemisia annua TaxID=35608 RepID=A0A2U1P7X0_ARTAN|nr:ankyrin repeat-containing domain, PGG domain protein [Artemisia annua]